MVYHHTVGAWETTLMRITSTTSLFQPVNTQEINLGVMRLVGLFMQTRGYVAVLAGTGVVYNFEGTPTVASGQENHQKVQISPVLCSNMRNRS